MKNKTFYERRPPRLLCLAAIVFILACATPDTALAQTGMQIKLFGYVRDRENGIPISGAYIDLRDVNGTQIADMTTKPNGYYEFMVPPANQYNIGITVWQNGTDYSFVRYIPTWAILKPDGVDQLETDFDLIPGANLIVHAYDSSGSLIRRAALQSLTFGHLYVSDLQDLSIGGISWAVHDGYSIQSGWQWDLAVPSLAIPLGRETRLHVLWEIPGFGRVLLNVDNQGKGYTLSKQGETFIIQNLIYEAAQSEYFRLLNMQEKISSLGDSIPPEILNEIQESTTNIHACEEVLDHSSYDKPEVTDAANLALKSILTAQEDLSLAEARQTIEQNRYGGLNLKIVDENGNPMEGVSVAYEQRSHDFLFGANPMGAHSSFNPAYATLMRDAGINYSYILFHWENIEPTPGHFEWTLIDSYQNIKEQSSYNFGLMGGLALWFNRGGQLGTAFSPLYQDQMTISELKTNIYDHMRTIAERYKNEITIWEINEQNMANSLNLTWIEKFDVYKAAIAGLKSGNPDAKVIFNSNALPYEFSSGNIFSEDEVARRGISFYEFLEGLSAHNIEFDYIGLEFYYSGGNTDGYVPPLLTLASLDNLLDLYAGFGKPIYICELSAPSDQQPNSTWWHRPWDQETQAEYLRDFYTIAFSKPLVQEIGWSYGVSDEDSFMPSGGILDSNLQPKASYITLKDLLTNQWITSGVKETGSGGEVEIRGFAGEYNVTVTSQNGNSTTVSLHIAERQNTEAEITLPIPIQATPTSAPIDRGKSILALPHWTYWVLISLIIIGLLLLLRHFRRT